MKILTWNLGGGDKRAAVHSMEWDIALLQERRQGDCGTEEPWCGEPGQKGLSVATRAPYRVMPVPDAVNLPKYFVPLVVEGPQSFQLISVWAMNIGQDKYIRGLVRAVDLWADRIAVHPTVIAGDFNANALWDDDHPADRNFSALAHRLGDLGLVSAYHSFFSEPFGQESRPTFHLYKHAGKPMHLDYCFIPRKWLPRLRDVTVGGWGEWGKSSDHMPVGVEIEG